MRYAFFFLLLISLSTTSQAAFTPATDAEASTTEALTSSDLTREAVEAKLGRKLKFKERVGLSIARGKVKRAERRKAKGKKPQASGPTDGFAIASLVLGVLGFFFLIPAIPALILGIISLGRINRDPQYLKGKGMAIAGIVMGGVVIIAILILVLAFAQVFAF